MWFIVTLAALLFAVVYFQQKTLVFPVLLTNPRGNFKSKYLVTGTNYACLFRPNKEGKPILVFYHGNCENIFTRGEGIIASIPEEIGVCIVEYDGYSVLKSNGPEWERIVESVNTCLQEQIGKDKMHNVIHVGYSLGTAVALRVVQHFETEGHGVHLIAPFTSIKDIVSDHMFWPFSRICAQLVRENIDSLEVARTLSPSSDKYVVYGCLNDELVPYRQSVMIANALQASFHTWNCKHNDFDIPFKDIVEAYSKPLQHCTNQE